MRLAHRDACRKVVFYAVVVAIAMIALCVTDLLASYPFQPFMGQTTFSITYLISSVIVLYMCWPTWHDLKLGDGPRIRNAVVKQSSGQQGRDRTTRTRNIVPSRRTDQRKSQNRATVP